MTTALALGQKQLENLQTIPFGGVMFWGDQGVGSLNLKHLVNILESYPTISPLRIY